MKNKAANMVKNLKTTANKVSLLKKPFTTPKPFKGWMNEWMIKFKFFITHTNIY